MAEGIEGQTPDHEAEVNAAAAPESNESTDQRIAQLTSEVAELTSALKLLVDNQEKASVTSQRQGGHRFGGMRAGALGTAAGAAVGLFAANSVEHGGARYDAQEAVASQPSGDQAQGSSKAPDFAGYELHAQPHALTSEVLEEKGRAVGRVKTEMADQNAQDKQTILQSRTPHPKNRMVGAGPQITSNGIESGMALKGVEYGYGGSPADLAAGLNAFEGKAPEAARNDSAAEQFNKLQNELIKSRSVRIVQTEGSFKAYGTTESEHLVHTTQSNPKALEVTAADGTKVLFSMQSISNREVPCWNLLVKVPEQHRTPAPQGGQSVARTPGAGPGRIETPPTPGKPKAPKSGQTGGEVAPSTTPEQPRSNENKPSEHNNEHKPKEHKSKHKPQEKKDVHPITDQDHNGQGDPNSGNEEQHQGGNGGSGQGTSEGGSDGGVGQAPDSTNQNGEGTQSHTGDAPHDTGESAGGSQGNGGDSNNGNGGGNGGDSGNGNFGSGNGGDNASAH